MWHITLRFYVDFHMLPYHVVYHMPLYRVAYHMLPFSCGIPHITPQQDTVRTDQVDPSMYLQHDDPTVEWLSQMRIPVYPLYS